MRSQVMSILVENTPGLLSHVSGLFSRRGYNIDSFSAGVTADPRFTRITIVASGDELILEPGSSVTRELMIVKISAKAEDRQSVLTITDIFHGKVVDVTHDSMVIEVTGHQDKLQSFLDMLADYEILELARTGLTGLTRGTKDVVIID